MPAVPALIMGGSALVSTFAGNKAQKDTTQELAQRTPEEMALMKSQTGLADQQRQQGAQLFNTAMPGINNTLNYYKTLLSGNRGARMNAVAPEAQDTAAAYEGADKALTRSNIRGGELVNARANNATAKAGSIARLTTGVRPGAAAALGSQSMGLLGGSADRAGQAGGIYGNLIGGNDINRQRAGALGLQAGNDTSNNLGALFANLMRQYGTGKGKSKGTTRMPDDIQM